MGNFIDSSGQWLIQLPLIGQLLVLVVVLFLFGGVAAYLLIGAIDIVHGFVVRTINRYKASGKGK